MTTNNSEYFLFSTEVSKTADLMGDRAARTGGYGVPVPRAIPWGRQRRNWEHRRKPTRHRRVMASRMRGVVLLDLLWSDRSHPRRGDGESDPSTPLPRRDGGKWRPPVAPECQDGGGVLDGRGRKGVPRRASALSSPGRQKKGGRERKSEEDKEKGKWSP